jgi:hypothetical protein
LTWKAKEKGAGARPTLSKRDDGGEAPALLATFAAASDQFL